MSHTNDTSQKNSTPHNNPNAAVSSEDHSAILANDTETVKTTVQMPTAGEKTLSSRQLNDHKLDPFPMPAQHEKPVIQMSKQEMKEAKKKTQKRKKHVEGQEIIKTNDWTAFRIVVCIVGIGMIGLGVWGLYGGIDDILGSASTSGFDKNNGNYPSLQSNYAFFNGAHIALGIAFIAVAFHIRWAQIIWVGSMMIFAGGVARLYSMTRWGTPNTLLIVSIIAELALPVALVVWYMWIDRSAKIKAEATAGQAQPGQK